jgi:hypothetical protein
MNVYQLLAVVGLRTNLFMSFRALAPCGLVGRCITIITAAGTSHFAEEIQLPRLHPTTDVFTVTAINNKHGCRSLIMDRKNCLSRNNEQ